MRYLPSVIILVVVILTSGCISAINEGDRLFNESRYDDALSYYDKAVIEDPKNAEGWIKRGAALDKLQRYQEAIDSIAKGISLNDTVCEPRLNGMCILTIHSNKIYFSPTKVTFSNEINESNLTDDIYYCSGNNCLINMQKIRELS